jgi:hypothetical protein
VVAWFDWDELNGVAGWTDPLAASGASGGWNFLEADKLMLNILGEIKNLKANLNGEVRWYHRPFPKGAVHRGVISRGSKVSANGPIGCIWAKPTWGHPTGSISLPPGLTVGGASIEGAWLVKCRSRGKDRPEPIDLSGLYAKKTLLNSLNLEIAVSDHREDGPRWGEGDYNVYGLN